jgi:hypothetical protein
MLADAKEERVLFPYVLLERMELDGLELITKHCPTGCTSEEAAFMAYCLLLGLEDMHRASSTSECPTGARLCDHAGCGQSCTCGLRVSQQHPGLERMHAVAGTSMLRLAQG